MRLGRGSKNWWIEAGIALAFAGAAWALYHPVLRLWWMYDDVHHLRHLITGRPGWYLFDASELRRTTEGILTPLLFLSLDVDRRLFGLAPYYFYLHQLLVFSLCPAALYGVLRIWLPRLWAAVGAGAFLAGPVIAALAPLLFVRHYVEAFLLASLAVAAWGGALRRTGTAAWALAALSAALYFAASMAKEIAVPLAVFLPLLPAPAGSPRTDLAARLRFALPHAVMLALYLALRYAVLGTLLGGYGFAVAPADWPALALALPGKIVAEFAGGRLSPVAVLFLAALAAGVLSLFLPRGRRAVLLTGIALCLALAPVLPVSTQMEPRFAVPAWIVLAVAFAAGCRALAERATPARAWARGSGVALAMVACLAGLVVNRQDWRVRFARVERMSAEDRFLTGMRDGDILRQPLTPAASLGELQWLKENVFHRARGGRWFQDDFYLCVHREPLGRVWGYDPALRRVVDVTARIPALRDRYCSSLRADAPLRASFRVSGGALYWDLGPAAEGKYSLLLGDGAAVFEMPRRAGFRMQARAPLLLRVKYESPAGWITCSPELRVPLDEGARVRWGR
jgi:hypothetical protein